MSDTDTTTITKKKVSPYGEHTGFGVINSSTTSMPMDSDTDTSGYSNEVIAYAELLKGQYESGSNPRGFSDEFYLDYAQRAIYGSKAARYGFVRSDLDAPPDPKYAQYSYEEILAMVNNGENVPKEVIAWAQAHQEADVTDYIVLDDTTETSDTNPDNNDSNGSDVNKLREQAKTYIKKSARAQSNLETNNEKIKELSAKAVVLSLKQQMKSGNSLDKAEAKTKLWKELDEKQKNGKLNRTEQALYKKLSKELKESNQLIKEIKSTSQELDNFLNSIDDLKDESKDALEIADDTLDAATKLSKNLKVKSDVHNTHTYQTSASSTDNILDNLLAGMTDEQIADTAQIQGRDLQAEGNDVLSNLESESSQDVAEFARDYTTRAGAITNVVEDLNDDENKNAAGEKEDSDDSSLNSEANKAYTLSKMTEPKFASKFAKVTTKQAGVTLAETVAMNTVSMVLETAAQKVTKGEKKLEKEAKAKTKMFDANNEDITKKNKELEDLKEKDEKENEERAAEVSQEMESGADVAIQNIPEEEPSENTYTAPAKEDEETSEEIVSEENKTKEEALNEDIKTITQDNIKLQKDVQKPINEENKLVDKNKKSHKITEKADKTVDKAINKLENKVTLSAEGGVLSTAAGIINADVLGPFQVTTGIAMQAHATTAPAGRILEAKGRNTIKLGIDQQKAGAENLISAGIGAAVEAIAQEQTNLTRTITQSSNSINKSAQAAIKRIAKDMGGLKVSDGTQQEDETQGADKQQDNTTDQTQDPAKNNAPAQTEIVLNSEFADNNNTQEPETNSNETAAFDVQDNNTAAKAGISNPSAGTIQTSSAGSKTDNKTEEKDNVEGDTETKTTDDKKENKVKNGDKTEEDKSNTPKNKQKKLQKFYGSNEDFTKILVAKSLQATNPLSILELAVINMKVASASVLDLGMKKVVVDKSNKVAGGDTNESADKANELKTKSAQIKASHDKNFKEAQSLQSEYIALKNDSTDQMFQDMQNQQKLVAAGKIAPEQVVQSADPNKDAKANIQKQLAGFESKESQLFAGMNKPLVTADKTNDASRKSVIDFGNLNDKLTDRNDNNKDLGNLIVGEAIVYQGVITAGIAVCAAAGVFGIAMLKLWLLTLAENVALSSSGVGALVVSNQVKGDIEDNNNDVTKDRQSLDNDQKVYLDQRKAVAKLESETKKASQKTSKMLGAQIPDMNISNSQAPETSNNEQSGNNEQDTNNIPNQQQNLKSTKFEDAKSDNEDFDFNNNRDLKNPNTNDRIGDFSIPQNNDESSAAISASVNTNTAGFDTNGRTDKKLSRFNKDGAIESKKKNRKVKSIQEIEENKKKRK